jgi:hypothetical protein
MEQNTVQSHFPFPPRADKNKTKKAILGIAYYIHVSYIILQYNTHGIDSTKHLFFFSKQRKKWK